MPISPFASTVSLLKFLEIALWCAVIITTLAGAIFLMDAYPIELAIVMFTGSFSGAFAAAMCKVGLAIVHIAEIQRATAEQTGIKVAPFAVAFETQSKGGAATNSAGTNFTGIRDWTPGEDVSYAGYTIKCLQSHVEVDGEKLDSPRVAKIHIDMLPSKF